MAAAPLDSSLLQTLGVAPLHESDNLLLYLVILALYKEGVRPTYSEVHYKLKEYHSPWDIERSFLVYYLLQPHRYVLKFGSTILESNITVARQLLTQHMTRSRSRKTHSPVSPIKPFQATDILIYFREEPGWFQGWVNLKDSENHYSLRSWSVLIAFFRSCTSTNPAQPLSSIFKQTRYSLAKSLKELGPPEIREMRLGEIAHMAQLAIQHGFLCYEANTIQPTWTSYTLASMKSFQLNLEPLETDSDAARELIRQLSEPVGAKEDVRVLDVPRLRNWKLKSSLGGIEDDVTADQQSTTVGGSTFKGSPRSDIPPLTDIQELKAAIKRLLTLEDCGQILLSQLRVILQARMHIHLIPWNLGYAKLSNLLIAECSDVCRLVRHGGRHVFVEAFDGHGSEEDTRVSRGDTSVLLDDDEERKCDSSVYGRESSAEENNLHVGAPSSSTTSVSPLSLCCVANEVSRYATLSSRIHSTVPLYLLDYSPDIMDYVMCAGRSDDPHFLKQDWDYNDIVRVASRLNGCRLAVLFHCLPISLHPIQRSISDVKIYSPGINAPTPIPPSSSFDHLLAIDWRKNDDPPALLLSSLID